MCELSGRFCARNVYFIFPVLRDWDERLWTKRDGIRAPSGAARRMGAIARSGDQFGIGLATRCRWQFPREPEGNCRETAIFRDGRLARSACNSGKSRGSCVRTYDSARVVQNSSAIFGLAVPRHARCSILDRTPAQVPPFLIFSAQNPAGSIRLANKPRKS